MPGRAHSHASLHADDAWRQPPTADRWHTFPVSATSPVGADVTRPGRLRTSVLLSSVGTRRVLVSLVVIVLLQQAAGPVQAWFAQRTQLATLRAEVAARQAAVSELDDQANRLKDPAYVEDLARTRLHMVKPGEQSYIVVGGQRPVLTDAPLVTSVATDVGQPWWTTLVNHIAAGPASASAAR